MGTILEILGCLGVFLYGMKVLSEGIQKTAGERMRNIMATMTTNRFAGVGTGFVTTCLLQSSSATTVIVVSFVNAGLLTLVESIGVIMGANLGSLHGSSLQLASSAYRRSPFQSLASACRCCLWVGTR